MADVTKILLLTILQLIGLDVVSACSPNPGTKQWSKEKTFFNAPAVVIATDVYHSVDASPQRFVEPEDNYSEFTVDCIMKSGGYTIGRTIAIHEGAARYSSLCHTTFTNVGTKYVLALKMGSFDRFAFYEPNVLTSGGVEATDENLRIAASVCGLDSPQAAPGAGAVGDVCPAIGDGPCEDGEESIETTKTWVTKTPQPPTTSHPFETWPESNSSTFPPAETTDSMETTCDYGEECGPGRSSWTIASVTLLTLCAALACDLVL